VSVAFFCKQIAVLQYLRPAACKSLEPLRCPCSFMHGRNLYYGCLKQDKHALNDTRQYYVSRTHLWLCSNLRSLPRESTRFQLTRSPLYPPSSLCGTLRLGLSVRRGICTVSSSLGTLICVASSQTTASRATPCARTFHCQGTPRYVSNKRGKPVGADKSTTLMRAVLKILS
jgi:hypothetical protein